MAQILPIGSVVEAGDVRLCLLGARMLEKEGCMTLAYCAVRHPRGYAGLESLGIVYAQDITRILFTGKVGSSGRQFLDGLTTIYRQMEGRTAAQAQALFDEMQEKYKDI